MTQSAHRDSFVHDHLPPADQWPELIFERPELQFPERLNACAELLDKAIEEGHGDRPAIIGASTRWTYRGFTSPTAYRQMATLASTRDLGSLAKCVSAGEALPTDTRDRWRDATGIEIHDGIGGTEMIHIYLGSGPEDYRPGSLGRILPGYRGMIVDDAMNPLPPGEVGKLAIKGPTGCRYLSDERQKDYVRDGWNLPGDAFHMDEDGYYYYHARIDDLIVSSGYNIGAPEVEWALLAHPTVAECGVIGVPDEARRQVVKAFVVLKPEFRLSDQMAAELKEFVKNTVAPYKYPQQIRFVDALPRTETGKLQRFRLKTLA